MATSPLAVLEVDLHAKVDHEDGGQQRDDPRKQDQPAS
jgi:hypothetical protein